MTGVLPIALGKATRIVQTLLKSGKEYICLMHLHKQADEELIKETFKRFLGKIKQIPPIKSAVKRQLRTREIYYLNILEIQDKDVLFKIGCEAGTYIRKICFDFGEKLGVGAQMAELVRTKVGPFTDKTWHSLHDLKDAYTIYKNENNENEIRKIILPIEKAVEHLPKIWILDSAVSTLCHGADLSIPGISKYNNFNENETIAVLTLKDELICLGNSLVNNKFIKENDKGKVIKTNKVFMGRSLYPKI